MAKFTTSRPLAMRYQGHDLTGPAGTVFRIPDSLRLPFEAEFGDQMPDLTWVEADEISSGGGGGGAHPDLATHDSMGLATDAALTAHDSDTNAHVYFALDADLTNHEAAGHPTLHAALIHSHAESAITNLTSDLAGKAATIHTHAESAVTNLVTDLSGKAATIHSHAESSITGLVTDLAAKAALSHAHVDADIPAGIARDSEVSAAIDNHSTTAIHGGSGSIPAGIIAMWGGLIANIPSGWALCNGLNGTPDLRGLFVKGAAPGADPGATGGSATHTHADHTGVISHTHPVNVTDPQHAHVQGVNSASTGGTSGYTADTSTNSRVNSGYSTSPASTGITATTSNPAGGVAALSHDSPNSEPPYFALAYIQKL